MSESESDGVVASGVRRGRRVVDAVGAVGAVVAEIVSHRAMVTGDFTPLFLTALSGDMATG